MAIKCAKCAIPCARTWKERWGTKHLCRDCFNEGYRLADVGNGKRTKIMVVPLRET